MAPVADEQTHMYKCIISGLCATGHAGLGQRVMEGFDRVTRTSRVRPSRVGVKFLAAGGRFQCLCLLLLGLGKVRVATRAIFRLLWAPTAQPQPAGDWGPSIGVIVWFLGFGGKGALLGSILCRSEIDQQHGHSHGYAHGHAHLHVLSLLPCSWRWAPA